MGASLAEAERRRRRDEGAGDQPLIGGRYLVWAAALACVLVTAPSAAAKADVGAPVLSIESVQVQSETSVRLVQARLRGAPGGSKITLTCRGGCFPTRVVRVVGRTRDLPLPALRNLTLTSGMRVEVSVRLGTGARRELTYAATKSGRVVRFKNVRRQCGTPRRFPSGCPAGIEYPLGIAVNDDAIAPALRLRVDGAGVWLSDYFGGQVIRFDRTQQKVSARVKLPSPRLLGTEGGSALIDALGRIVRIDARGAVSDIADTTDCLAPSSNFNARPMLVARWVPGAIMVSCPEGIVRIDTATGRRSLHTTPACSFFPGTTIDSSRDYVFELIALKGTALAWCSGAGGGFVPGLVRPNIGGALLTGGGRALLPRIGATSWVVVDDAGQREIASLSPLLNRLSRGLIVGDLLVARTSNGTVRIGGWDGRVRSEVYVGIASDVDVDRGELWYFNQETQGLGKADLRRILGGASGGP